MVLSLPDQPASGIVTDLAGIQWRQNPDGRWDADACPTCGTRLDGDLSWSELLRQRGPLTPV